MRKPGKFGLVSNRDCAFTLILVFIISSCIILNQPVKADSAAPQVQWTKRSFYGDTNSIRGMTHTSDGGYALYGLYMDITLGQAGFWLVKTDSSGNEQWQQTYSNLAHAYCAIQTSDGGYALTDGISLGKSDSSGNLQWTKACGGETMSLVQTSDGGYALSGGTGLSFLLIKTDATGKQLWNQTYTAQGDKLAWSVIQTNDGGYALTGSGCLIKTDSLGKMQWKLACNGTSYCVIQATDGGYVVAGSIPLEGGNNNMWLLKVDSLGNMQWNQTYNEIEGNNFGWYGAWSVIQTNDGGYALGGSSGVVKVDSSGNLQWSLPLNGTTYSVVQTSDGGYAFAGGNFGFYSGTWLASTDTSAATASSPSPSPVPSALQKQPIQSPTEPTTPTLSPTPKLLPVPTQSTPSAEMKSALTFPSAVYMVTTVVAVVIVVIAVAFAILQRKRSNKSL
ncbi:MAG TPA: hypothetical protein VLU95_08595 [Candidatus Acidoferrum sp.]|nr:hypothetical protein [Candidatus Acidoferrum sp.]